MDVKIVLVVVASLIVGAAAGGMVMVNYGPESGDAGAQGAQPGSAELEAAKKAEAEARTEAAHWQRQYERLEQELDRGSVSDLSATEPLEDLNDSAGDTPAVMDAALLAELEEYRARDAERQEREELRDERNAERRADWARTQTEMLNRRTDMFTDLIERTDDPAEQQRWADIERNMTQARDLMREMREADTDEERSAVRDSLRQNFESTQGMLKEQQNAVLQRALEAEGISDADQLAQVQRAVQSSLQDEAFRMGGGPPGGGRGFGGSRGGFGGGGGRGPR